MIIAMIFVDMMQSTIDDEVFMIFMFHGACMPS